MALIPCADCGGFFPDTADTCPKCGWQNKSDESVEQQRAGRWMSDEFSWGNAFGGAVIGGFITVFVFLFLFLFVSVTVFGDETQAMDELFDETTRSIAFFLLVGVGVLLGRVLGGIGWIDDVMIPLFRGGRSGGRGWGGNGGNGGNGGADGG